MILMGKCVQMCILKKQLRVNYEEWIREGENDWLGDHCNSPVRKGDSLEKGVVPVERSG